MGYCYDGRGRLCCDKCGQAGGVRKRTCPHKVLSDSSQGPRTLMGYCAGPALDNHCYALLGGVRGVHKDCAAEAAASQAVLDAVEARLDAGELYALAAWGDWHAKVPAGLAGVKFGGRHGDAWFLVSAGEYDPGRSRWLTDYPQAKAWTDHTV